MGEDVALLHRDPGVHVEPGSVHPSGRVVPGDVLPSDDPVVLITHRAVNGPTPAVAQEVIARVHHVVIEVCGHPVGADLGSVSERLLVGRAHHEEVFLAWQQPRHRDKAVEVITVLGNSRERARRNGASGRHVHARCVGPDRPLALREAHGQVLLRNRYEEGPQVS